jgi:Dolichyl-phosphate-mannose-protein mannosyltransferase
MTARLCAREPVPVSCALGVLLLALALFVLTGSGHVQTIDVDQSVSVAEHIVQRGDIAIDFPVVAGGGGIRGHDQRVYSGHDIGLAALFVPIAASRYWNLIPPNLANFLYTLVDPIFGAATVLVFLLFAWELTENISASAAAAIIVATTTTVWPYAHVSFDAEPTAFFLLTSAYLLYRAEQRESSWPILGSAVAAGAAVLVRQDSAIIVAFLGGWFLIIAWRKYREVGADAVATVLLFVVPLVGAAGVTFWHNTVRFGSWFDNGHGGDPKLKATTPLWRGLAGQLVSPGKGLVFFVPSVLIAIVGWWLMRARHSPIWWIVPAAALANLVYHSRLAVWSGEEAWGPRFAVPIVPLIMLPLCLVIARWVTLNWLIRFTVAVVLMAGLSVQAAGVGVDYYAVERQHRTSLEQEAWRTSQIVLGWQALDRSLHGKDPDSSVTHGAVAPKPVPRLDFWWIDSKLARANRQATQITTLVLAVTFVMALVWVIRSSSGLRVDPRRTDNPHR